MLYYCYINSYIYIYIYIYLFIFIYLFIIAWVIYWGILGILVVRPIERRGCYCFVQSSTLVPLLGQY